VNGGGGGQRPHYNPGGTFNGHTILLIPARRAVP